jgi:imidazolonepropionase-like amidohydrolase
MIAYSTQDRIRLVNARIADVENGRYFDPGLALVIQNGRIIAMPGLPGEPEDCPADAVIDLRGMAVIPGLFNTHCHLQLGDLGKPRETQITRNLEDCLARGVTTVRDTLCYDLSRNRLLIDKIGRGELRGPRIHQAVHVGPLGGTYTPVQGLDVRVMFTLLQMPVVPYDDPRSGAVAFRPQADAQEVRAAVDRAIDERGATAVKFCDQPERFPTYAPGATVISDRQLEAAADQAMRRGVPTTMHNVTVTGFRQAVRAGVGSLAHLPIDGELTDADAEQFLRSGASVEPTLTVAYYMSYNMKGSPVNGHPEIERLARYRDATLDAFLGETWPGKSQEKHRALHEILHGGEMKLYGVVDMSSPFRFMAPYVVTGGANLRRLAGGGASGRLACGNDAGPADCSPAVIHQELGMFDFLLNAGDGAAFRPADALRAATIQSARAMHVEDRLGSIRTGKIADLAVLDGDPLSDFNLIGGPVQALFMDGKLVVDLCGLELNGTGQ